MTCPICRNGELVPGTAETSMSHEGVTLVVRGVPAEVCNNCGERYFDAEVTQRLLDIAREAVAAGVVVDVRNYVAA
jgi:YgiT-type zinc finger domain-containing protein